MQQKLLESSDVAQLVGVSADTVRADAVAGLITVAAVTSRGGRLFSPEAVEAYRLARRERREQLERRAGAR